MGGRLVRRLGPGRAIPWFMLFALGALLVLTAALGLQASLPWLVFAAFLLACAMGAVSTLVFGLMMFFSRQNRQAADYGLQASLFVLTRLLVPIGAGVLLDRSGALGMLAGLSLAMVGVCGLALAARRSITQATAGVYGQPDKAVGAPPGSG
ncbi:major facilitator transporter [Pseudomonas sp. CF161]|nr:major facilitator transporter [Pseudomonas sp. CF161]